MAPPRWIRLAELLSEGRDGVEAMIEAGWPEIQARGLGPNAVEHCAKAGLVVTLPRATQTTTAGEVPPLAPESGPETQAPTNARRAERRKERTP